MLLKGKPFTLEISEFSDVQALESHPGSIMKDCKIHHFLSRADNNSVRA
ncbi:MAG: hypothetical protein K0R36_3530 [Chryseobacterium sp.]|jgi:hypothetical protein|nr:hypothetical protein [Chryseobacterium sp.]